jgi:phosphoglycolate phosphatase
LGIRGLLLDRDGTIVDLHAPFIRIARRAAAAFSDGDPSIETALLQACGFQTEADRMGIGCIFAAGTHEDVAAAWQPLLPRISTESLYERLESIGEQEMAGALPISGTLAAIQDFRLRGYSLGMATNATAFSAHASLDRLGLRESLGFVAGCDSGYGAKPEPGMALAFCAASGIEPGQAAIIGDTPHDMQTGKNAGLGLCIGVLSGAGTKTDLIEAGADAILPSLAEAVAFLRR